MLATCNLFPSSSGTRSSKVVPLVVLLLPLWSHGNWWLIVFQPRFTQMGSVIIATWISLRIHKIPINDSFDKMGQMNVSLDLAEPGGLEPAKHRALLVLHLGLIKSPGNRTFRQWHFCQSLLKGKICNLLVFLQNGRGGFQVSKFVRRVKAL